MGLSLSAGSPAPGAYNEIDAAGLDLSIVIPCLNESRALAHCLENAGAALRRVNALYGLKGEILIADNGSTDGSQALARALGARVVEVRARGYGAAIKGGCVAARGRLLVIGDADGSYDFCDGVQMVGELLAGADLCIGSRFRGGIAKGAMPWKNRYIGNPALTGLLNLFFRSGVQDAHCGLRAITRDAFAALDLSSTGMEFASEMVVKASLKRLRITQAPVTLAKDLRDRPPHLRPWRDGWRHLRFLIMLSPTWAFGVPAALCMAASMYILAFAVLHCVGLLAGTGMYGTSWQIIAGFLFTSGHFAAVMAVAMHIFGVRQGHRPLRPSVRIVMQVLTLEKLIAAGLAMMICAFGLLAMIAAQWSAAHYVALPTVLPLVLTAVLGATGMQTIFGAFVLGILMEAGGGQDVFR